MFASVQNWLVLQPKLAKVGANSFAHLAE